MRSGRSGRIRGVRKGEPPLGSENCNSAGPLHLTGGCDRWGEDYAGGCGVSIAIGLGQTGILSPCV